MTPLKTLLEGHREKKMEIFTLTISISYQRWEQVHSEELD